MLPLSFTDQIAAQRLAVCNDIGEASYVDSLIAAALLECLRTLPHSQVAMDKLKERLQIDFVDSMSGEDYVAALADNTFHGHMETAGQRILNNYRQGYLGAIALELPR